VAGRKTTKPAAVLESIVKSVRCCPGRLGRKGSERDSVLGDRLFGPGTASAPSLCCGTLVFDM